jgi:hypothetical protein
VLLAVWGAALPVAAQPAPPQACEPVLGLYAVPVEACSLVASHGFTTIHNYRFESDRPLDVPRFVGEARAYLDAAARHGLDVLLGVPRNWLRDRREADVREVVRALADHPALLAWYEDEQAQSGRFDSVRLLARSVEAEDPEHGLIIEEGRNDSRLLGIGRVRMFTYYPVTARARRAGRLRSLRGRFPVHALRVPFWPVLQAFGRDLVAGYRKPDLVAPTQPELRYTLYSALGAGARGLFFYTFLHSTRYDEARAAKGQWPYEQAQPLPEMAPQLWRTVLECAREARTLLPLLENAVAVDAVEVLEGGEDLEVAQWRTPHGTYVLLANPTYEARRVELQARVATGGFERLDGAAFVTLRGLGGARCDLLLSGPGGVCLRLRAADD